MSKIFDQTSSGIDAISFDKYDASGAYHWSECDYQSRSFNPALLARYEMIISRAQGRHALDVGAGDGYLTWRLAARFDSIIGVESEDRGVELASTMLESTPNAKVEKGSAYELPFPDGHFDCVVMADVIEHLDRPERAVSEMARVSTQDALVYISTPQWRPDRVWDKRHVKEYRPEELIELIKGSFQEVDMVYAWPKQISDLNRTRVGWRFLRFLGRRGINLFRRESLIPHRYCQMLAIASRPK